MSDDEAPIRWIRIAGFTDALSARIASGRLESEGIPVTVLNEHFVTANWLLSSAVGGVQVLVPAEHVEVSRQLLRDQAEGEFDLGDDADVPACPHCGGTQWERQTRGRHVALAVIALTALPLPFLGDHWICARCHQPQPDADGEA